MAARARANAGAAGNRAACLNTTRKGTRARFHRRSANEVVRYACARLTRESERPYLNGKSHLLISICGENALVTRDNVESAVREKTAGKLRTKLKNKTHLLVISRRHFFFNPSTPIGADWAAASEHARSSARCAERKPGWERAKAYRKGLPSSPLRTRISALHHSCQRQQQRRKRRPMPP